MPRPTVPALTASKSHTTAIDYVARHRSWRVSLIGNGYQPRHARRWTP